MGDQSVFYITTLSAFFALAATIFQGYFSSNELKHLTSILSSLTDLEYSNKSLVDVPRVAVGYGACTDVYLNAVEFLNASEFNNPSWTEDAPPSDKITNNKELLQTFGYFFSKGAAAERLIENQQLFQELLARTRNNNVLIRRAIGLNAPGMANRFAQEGAQVLLGADISIEQRTVLHTNIQLASHPTTHEDIHLILEYKSNSEWGPLTAPRANRFIVRTDSYNPILKTLEPEFTDSFSTFGPRLFAISGLHVMDNDPEQSEVRRLKLNSLTEQLKGLSSKTLVHFEMASYVEKGYLRDIFKSIIPHTDSLGMNEQELQNLEQVFTKDEISLVADFNPTVERTWQQTRDVYKHLLREYSSEETNNKRSLSRIHVHTLGYQLIMTEHGSEWRNSRRAAAKAALVAHRYVCGTDFVNPEAANLLLDGEFKVDNEMGLRTTLKVTEKEPVQCWNEVLTVERKTGGQPRIVQVEVCVAPVLVCRVAKWTTGAGDNISAAGLIVQI